MIKWQSENMEKYVIAVSKRKINRKWYVYFITSTGQFISEKVTWYQALWYRLHKRQVKRIK